MTATWRSRNPSRVPAKILRFPHAPGGPCIYGPGVQNARHRQDGIRVVHAAAPGPETEWQPSRDVFITIGTPLCRLVGRDGYRGLLARSLHLASEDYPLLRTVRPAFAPAGRLVGLPSGDAPWEREELSQALGQTLTVMFRLLRQFLGNDLTRQILEDVSVDIPDTPLLGAPVELTR